MASSVRQRFLEAVWGPWLQKGRLRESNLEIRDPHLLRAYRRWIATHRRDRVKALKAPLSELERHIYSVTPDTPWAEIERIALAIVKQRHGGAKNSADCLRHRSRSVVCSATPTRIYPSRIRGGFHKRDNSRNLLI